MRKSFATILLFVFVLTIQGYAQSITGSLNGRVVDQQGSAVPEAKVTAIEPTKKVTVVTNATGVGDFSIRSRNRGRTGLLEKPRREIVQTAAPRQPFVRRIGRLEIDVVNAGGS